MVNRPGITFDVDAMLGELQDLAKRQVVFATALALNRTVEEMQAAVRLRIFQRGFTIRTSTSARYLANSIKFARGDRATKTSLVARLRIEPPGKGGGRGGLLAFLEEGGVRFSQFAIGSGAVFGPGSVAIPYRTNPMQTTPRNLYPTQTGLQERRAIDGSLTRGTLRGKRRTFAVRTRPGEGLVLQRTGKPNIVGGRDASLRPIFVIKPRVVVPGRRFFFPTAERTAVARFGINLEGFMQHAMKTAR